MAAAALPRPARGPEEVRLRHGSPRPQSPWPTAARSADVPELPAPKAAKKFDASASRRDTDRTPAAA